MRCLTLIVDVTQCNDFPAHSASNKSQFESDISIQVLTTYMDPFMLTLSMTSFCSYCVVLPVDGLREGYS
jgi:hypothetical protein